MRQTRGFVFTTGRAITAGSDRIEKPRQISNERCADGRNQKTLHEAVDMIFLAANTGMKSAFFRFVGIA